MTDKWTIGSTIRNLREEQGIKQSQLCRGLCSVSTLSKFENGERELDYFLVVVLMQRLGYGLSRYEFYGSNEEWKQWEAMCNINQLRQAKEEQRLRAALDSYRSAWKGSIDKSDVQKQFITWIQGVLEVWAGRYEQAENLFERAVAYTLPEWQEMRDGKGVGSILELGIIIELGDAYAQSGKKEKAYSTWYAVWKYVDQNQGRILEMLPLYTALVLRMSPCLLEQQSFREGLMICERTLAALSKYCRVDNWSGLLYWKGRFQEGLLDRGEVSEEALIGTYKRAYYAARLFDEQERADELRSSLESRGVPCIR